MQPVYFLHNFNINYLLMKYIPQLIVVLCLYGCTPTTPPAQHTPVSKELKSDFNFKVGSYWVYKDSLSGRIDSFFVVSNVDTSIITSYGGHDYPKKSYESIRISVLEYNVNHFPNAVTSYWNYTFEGFDVLLSPYHYFFQYPGKDSFSIANMGVPGYDTGKLNNVFPDYHIYTSSFATVAVINHHFAASKTTYRYNDLFYISPGIGIIKMSLYHVPDTGYNPSDSINRVWELQRWHIEK